MENRNGLIVDVPVTEATGTADREAALGDARLADPPGVGRHWRRQGYDTKAFALKPSASGT
ncbi:MAG: hypothetical protein HS107_12865 [Thermoflexaceae bacterium]|nr:hypothetical protein [Thermoflexaceae bacterium]